MIDMKRPKPKKSADKSAQPGVVTSEEYPYGLRISLEREELDKLKLDISKLKIGEKCAISANGDIQSFSISENKGSPDSRSISIQIKELEITWSGASKSLYNEYLQKKNAKTSGKLVE